MIIHKDEPHFTNKEDVLAYVNERNKQRTFINSRNDGIEPSVFGTIQSNTGDGTGYGTGEENRTSNDSRGNGDIESPERSAPGIIEQLRQFNTEASRGNGSSYQYIGTTTGERNTNTITKWTGNLKSKFKPFKQAYQKITEPTKTERTKKTVVSEKRLTDIEIIKYRPKLIDFILWTSEHLDQFIIATTKGHDPNIEIWGDIDKDDAEILADFMLAHGKNNGKMAKVVRQAVTLADKIKVAIIIAPRMYKTAVIYLERGIGLRK